MAKDQSVYTLIWGILLAAMGVALFFRIPQVMPQIAQIEQFVPLKPFIRFSFYLMAVLLLIGGGRKIYQFIKDRPKP